MEVTPVYYVQLLDDNYLTATLEMLINRPEFTSSIDTNVIILSDTTIEEDKLDNIKTFTIPGYFIDLYRRHDLGKNERETVLSHEDYLIAIQLILAEYNKQDSGDFDVDTSDVLQTAKTIMRMKMGSNTLNTDENRIAEIKTMYHEYLVKCNSADMADVYHRIKTYLQEDVTAKNKYILIGGTKTELEQSFIQLLCGDHEVAVVTVETPLEESNNKPSGIELLFDRQPWSQLNLCSSCSKSSQMPATEVFVRRVIFAYLTLLVNSRNEIALARCLNIPDRELDHLAFTALKKMAKEKNMPMFQTAISFVMKIRIKCAITDDPLSPYVKGMNEFVNMIQKLQIIIEEDPDTSSSLRRVLNVIKNTICKSNDVKLRKSSVEAVTRKLHDEIDQLIVTNKNANSKQSPQVSVSNGGSIAGRQSIKLLRLLLDHECCQDSGNNSVSVLSDCYSSQKTPIRFPSLLSQFRSPDQCSPDEPENQTLIERVSLKVNKPQSSFQQISHQSCMAWADEDMLKKPALDPLMIYQDAPLSATHDVTSDVTANNIKNTKESFLIVKKQKDLKKRILEEIGDDEIEIEEPPVENAKKKSKKNKEVKTNIVKESKSKKTSSVTRNRKKAMPLQKGQKQMTQFFRL